MERRIQHYLRVQKQQSRFLYIIFGITVVALSILVYPLLALFSHHSLPGVWNAWPWLHWCSLAISGFVLLFFIYLWITQEEGTIRRTRAFRALYSITPIIMAVCFLSALNVIPTIWSVIIVEFCAILGNIIVLRQLQVAQQSLPSFSITSAVEQLAAKTGQEQPLPPTTGETASELHFSAFSSSKGQKALPLSLLSGQGSSLCKNIQIFYADDANDIRSSIENLFRQHGGFVIEEHLYQSEAGYRLLDTLRKVINDQSCMIMLLSPAYLAELDEEKVDVQAFFSDLPRREWLIPIYLQRYEAFEDIRRLFFSFNPLYIGRRSISDLQELLMSRVEGEA